MQLSYWEKKNWFTNVDFTIVGSGIVGLHTALRLRELYPKNKILILERGMLPQGASTKNAGFACFGSLSEILDDLKRHSEAEVLSLVEKRWNGLKMLRNRLGDEAIGFKNYGGYELFFESDSETYHECLQNIEAVNRLLFPLFGENVFSFQADTFGFAKKKDLVIYNRFEGQIDTGNMMQNLLKQVYQNDILILNHQKVIGFEELSNSVEVFLENFSFKTKKLIFATNGFASQLTNQEVIPARAQVLITKPIENLRIKGVFHMDKGYYYFRNVGNRILLGGARNLDFETETTTEIALNEKIQNRLEEVLKTVILPNQDFEIEHRWSGIMGMGKAKLPIIKQHSENVYYGVRLGGIGIAIGSLIGKELAEIVTYN